MVDPTRLFSGQGKLYVSDRTPAGGAAGFEFLGNCSSLSISPSVDSTTHEENQTGNNFVDKTINKMLKVEMSMTLDSIAKEALNFYLFGSDSSQAEGTITDEMLVAASGKAIKLAKGNVESITSVADKPTGEAGRTAYTVDTDYVLMDSKFGLVETKGATITDGQQIYVTYKVLATETVNAFTKSINKDVTFLFAGLNRAEDNNPVRVTLFKVRLGPAQEWQLINDEFAEFQVDGQVLYDALQPAATGGWFTIDQLVPAV